jgi:hypothetical protein
MELCGEGCGMVLTRMMQVKCSSRNLLGAFLPIWYSNTWIRVTIRAVSADLVEHGALR